LTIEQFIRSQIGTVDSLRALLLLHSDPKVVWDAVTVSGRLYLLPETAARLLQGLAAKGLIEVVGDPQYRYGPQSPELAGLVEQLAQLDREQPVTLINLVYARPEDVAAFAEAFRLKKEDR
jgi:hypothetical protein